MYKLNYIFLKFFIRFVLWEAPRAKIILEAFDPYKPIVGSNVIYLSGGNSNLFFFFEYYALSLMQH